MTGGASADRRLYLCTPDRPDLEAFVGACIEGGVDVVQLREKHLDDSDLVARAALVQRVCAAAGVPFVLNDRPDLAAAIGADGVHVGQDDLSPADGPAAGRRPGPHRPVHPSPDELDAAVGIGAARSGRSRSTTSRPARWCRRRPNRAAPGTGLGYVSRGGGPVALAGVGHRRGGPRHGGRPGRPPVPGTSSWSDG